MKGVVILGSTGSIGRQTLDVIRALPDRFQVIGLAAGRNLALLADQIREFRPRLAFYQDWLEERHFPTFPGCRLCTMEEMVTDPEADLVMVGTVGKVGLQPTLAALRAKKKVALASKEVIVMAGPLIMKEAKKAGIPLLPVDSEPSAVWQCLQNGGGEVSRIFITASGGPFRNRTLAEMGKVTSEEALRHPTWEMGRKITIDSATLMNKGLEVIEAHWLFGVPFERIEVVVHPQSVVHAMVEFADGSVKAQISPPDMRLPIQVALSYPERWHNPILPRLDPVKIGSLTFESIDCDRFPCFQLAMEAGKKGGTYPAVLSAADEVAVGLFLSQRIGFLEIHKILQQTLDAHRPIATPSLEELLQADEWARQYTARLVPE